VLPGGIAVRQAAFGVSRSKASVGRWGSFSSGESSGELSSAGSRLRRKRFAKNDALEPSRYLRQGFSSMKCASGITYEFVGGPFRSSTGNLSPRDPSRVAAPRGQGRDARAPESRDRLLAG